MRLAGQVKFILFPVIVSVFLITGFLSYKTLKQQYIDRINEKLIHEINLIYTDIENQTKSTNSLIWQQLNSRESITYFNHPNNHYNVFTFETRMTRMVSASEEFRNNLNSLTIFDNHGASLLYVNLVDPFAEGVLQADSRQALDKANYLLKGEYRVDHVKTFFGLHESDNGEQYLLGFRMFSPEKLLSSRQYNHADSLYLIQIENKPLLNSHRVRINNKFNDQVNLVISSGEFSTVIVHDPEVAKIPKQDDSLSVGLSTALIDIELTVSEKYINEQLWPLRITILLSQLLLSIFCYFSLNQLIRRQIINPIVRLADQVKNTKVGETQNLKPLLQKNEITELNNRYLTLIGQINILASNDALTGLANRGSFNSWVARSLNKAASASSMTGLLFIDLDNFKKVNDTLGHDVGDALLICFGEKLQEALRGYDELYLSYNDQSVSRLGGDEFAILLNDIPNVEAAALVAERIVSMFNKGFEVGDLIHDVQASIGIAIAPDDGLDADTLMRHADAAMYTAKKNGKNGFRFFSKEIERQLREHHHIETTLKESLKTHSFYLLYQPIYSLDNLRISGFEVLVRCQELQKENIGPDKFIPIAEITGLIKEIDVWVLENALANFQSLIELTGFDGYCSVNISGQELSNDKFVLQLEKLLNKYDVPAKRLELEITETSLVADDKVAVKTLHEIKKLGVKLSLDDFGTGYISFTQLAIYPVDKVKIDRSFVDHIKDDTDEKRLTVDIIVDLAKLYELDVTVEGIEELYQLEHMKKLNCELAQGYYLSKPIEWQNLVIIVDDEKETRCLDKPDAVTN